jgi:outer membrane protein assembly factor BamB
MFIAAATCVSILPAQLAGGVGSTGALEFDSPSGLAFGGGHLWVSNEMGNSVSEINPTNRLWIATLNSKIYGFQRPTAITRYGPYLFVANGVGSVSELRASNGAFIRIISGARYHFVNPVAIEAAGTLILVLNAGRPNAAGTSAGSITEIRASSGSLVRTVSGSRFAFSDPMAFAVSGADVFVADKGDNSVTEVRITTGRLVRVVAQQGLSAPDGIAVEDGNAWVSDSASSAATEIATGTGTVITTVTDAEGSYGFGTPSMVIGTGGNVYVASPFGSSPMVTKLSATSGQPSWFMCNTNGPYYFSLLSAFAVSGSDLWVASRSGANSATPGARSGSLTELSTGDGSLIATVPIPTTVSTTTSTVATTTTLP